MSSSITPPHVPNLEDVTKGNKSPLGNSKTPPEPLFETDDSVLPSDDRPADGSDQQDPAEERKKR